MRTLSLDLETFSSTNLATARSLLSAGDSDALELLYSPLPDTLSQLIRTAFIPSKGHRFIVADFSAIEARVLAWFSGEEGTLQAFHEGKDLYCQTASRMFGVPVEKHGANAKLRQKGKIAVLPCGYGGSVGALKAVGHYAWALMRQSPNPWWMPGRTPTRWWCSSGETLSKRTSPPLKPEPPPTLVASICLTALGAYSLLCRRGGAVLPAAQAW